MAIIPKEHDNILYKNIYIRIAPTEVIIGHKIKAKWS